MAWEGQGHHKKNSPASTRSAAQRHASTSGVFVDGLRWNDQFSAMPVFLSAADGPQIDAWPVTSRQYTLGAERYVTASALFPAGISLRSPDNATALRKITITNGRQLFRSFAPSPNATTFYRTLLLVSGLPVNTVFNF